MSEIEIGGTYRGSSKKIDKREGVLKDVIIENSSFLYINVKYVCTVFFLSFLLQTK